MLMNKRIVTIASLLASVKARSLASVKDVMTVGCFDALQAINILYKVIK